MSDYSFVPISGPPDATFVRSVAINDSGDFTGSYYDVSNYVSAGFVYSGGIYTTLNGPSDNPEPGNPDSGNPDILPAALNAFATVIGTYQYSDGNSYGFVYSDGTYTTLPEPSDAQNIIPVAINDAGTIIGNFQPNDAYMDGFIYSGGVYITLTGPSGSVYTIATAINASGTVVGTYNGSEGAGGFIYSGGIYTTMTALSDNGSVQPTGINASGVITGHFFDSDGNQDGFIDNHGTYTILTGPAGSSGITPSAINASGTITGNYYDSTGHLDGFIDSDGTYTTITGPSGNQGVYPLAINDSGTVTGFYYDSGGGFHGFLEELLCYLRGTHILTPTGEVAVQDLQIGDLVVTRFAGIQPIKWIGHQSYATRFLQNNRKQHPVRIQPGALGDRLPMRPLCVSPGHSMLVDGTLLLASALVNGITITQSLEHVPAVIEYFQIELEHHDCIMAEGAWSETFADGPGLRAQFHNAAEYGALYPDTVQPDALVPLCAPRPLGGVALDTALRPLVARATVGRRPGHLEGFIDTLTPTLITGWAMNSSQPDLPVLLKLYRGNKLLGKILACDHRPDLLAAAKGNGNHAFYFAPTSPCSLIDLRRLRVTRAADEEPLPRTTNCMGLAA